MKKLVLILLLAGPLGIVFQACSPCNCPPVESYYKTNNIHFVAYKTVKKPTEELIPLSENGLVKADSLALNIQLGRTYYSKHKTNFSFGLIQSAYACKCLQDGYKGSTEKILAIQVTSLKEFNSTIPAGSDITSIATINDLSVNNFIQNWNNNGGGTSNYTLVGFTQAMATETQQQFAVRIETNMGTFTDSTLTFTVIP